MSGRSAHVRKKITETKIGEKNPISARVEAKSTVRDDVTIIGGEYPPPPGTGYSTTNARFLKFSETIQDSDLTKYRGDIANLSKRSSGSQSGGSDGGRRDTATPYHQGPMPQFAYALARKPVLKMEDISGIERSGFRSAMDKQSDSVRKGLSKAFAFGKKKKGVEQEVVRSPSEATVRGFHEDSDYVEPPPMPAQNQLYGTVWETDNNIYTTPLPPPSAQLPPIPSTSTTPSIKRWIGAGRPVQRWNKLRKDPELWDPNGDVLVFFGRKGQSPRPNPSFRLSSHIIEATESRYLITLLREGSTEEDVLLPPSPAGAPPMLSHYGNHQHLGHNGQPTPPISEDTSHGESDGQISYEMYFSTPPNLTKIDAHRHAVGTRNVFALLYHASLVGLSLYQALSDLHARLEAYMPPGSDNVGTILNYLSARGIDDARNDAETAVSLLAWSEKTEVRWEEGWREAFLHCAGIYDRLEECADFKSISPITRALLERACLETQLRVQAAEERLATFGNSDIWPPTGPSAASPARAAADRLQKFLIEFYTKTHGSWPPSMSGARTSDGEEMWLTRTMAQGLQKDFGALYDYLVNRDIIWDESETRSSRKWMMFSESGNRAFEADTPELPLTDMLIEFDNRMRFPHIPHPYPLVPESIPPCATSASGREKLKKSEKEKLKANEDRILERKVQLAYTEATNIYILGSDFTHSDLIDSFVKFEKSDQIGVVDPMMARRGRWVLIYVILQTLASVSVDSPNVRYKDGVAYHLSPRLKGTKTPPWKGVSTPAVEAAHELSHCWLVPCTWISGTEGIEGNASVASADPSPVLKMMRSQAQKFPRPPPTPTSRSSNAGWQTPATRSVRSSLWGGSSAMSVTSDDTSSAHPSHRSRNRSAVKGMDQDDERDWPARKQSIRSASRPPPLPLTIHSSVTGNGGFLNLEESPRTSARDSRPLLSGGSSDGLGPVIRDYDELSVIDDHAP